jgi:hypothetical protein
MNNNMKSLIAAIAITLALVGSALAAPVKAVPKPTSKPVSDYMRKAGVIYLEAIKSLEGVCLKADEDSVALCDTELESSTATFQGLEDRVDINISGSRESGDKPYWALLKHVKGAELLFLTKQHGTYQHLLATEKIAKMCLETYKTTLAESDKASFDDAEASWQQAVDVPFDQKDAEAATHCVSVAHSIALSGVYSGRSVDVAKDMDCSFIK